jgi:hypothetical protein
MGTVAVGLVACLLAGVSLGAGPGVVVASANEPPLVDAGLDQSVRTNATVYLDAGGSLDADGTITQHRWEIEHPNGTVVAPNCESCVTTEFVPRATGRYEVTVTVTDDDGATASDTLYVEVQNRTPAAVELSGPGTLVAGATGTFEATAQAGEAAVTSVAWDADGSTVESQVVDDAGTWSHNLSFDDPGNHTVSVAVTDALGQQTRERYEVRVVSAVADESQASDADLSGAGGGGSGGSPPGGGYVSYASDGDSLLFSDVDGLYLSDAGSDSLALSPSDVEAGLERVSEENIKRSCNIGTASDCSGRRDVTVTGEAADVLANQLEINPSGLRTSFTGGGIDAGELERELDSGVGEESGDRRSSGGTTGRYTDSHGSSNSGGTADSDWTTQTPSVDWTIDETSPSHSSLDESDDSSSSSSGTSWSTESATANWDIDEIGDSSTSDSDDDSGGSDSNSDSGGSNSGGSSDSSDDDDGGEGCNFDWYC